MHLAYEPAHQMDFNPAFTVKRATVMKHVRPLKGRNRSALVKAANGRHYVQKVLDAFGDSNLLFNEAFGSRLGSALGLSFPDWVELIDVKDNVIPSTCKITRNRQLSFFGSELISGAIFEYLPVGWYRKVQNQIDAYRCLLFDLWCNHTDSRQAIYQGRGSRFHLYFIDHDLLFSTEERDSIQERIAQTRHLDLRLYSLPIESVKLTLSSFAAKIEHLVWNDLDAIVAGVPRYWGSAGHRQKVLRALRRRSRLLRAYSHEILEFATTNAQAEPDLV
jgi:hypothetical protein